jgi:multidrug efflux pump
MRRRPAAPAIAAAEGGSMTLPEISIRRPVFATVMSLTIMLLGLVSFQQLTIREYPKIDEPAVTVDTTYRGASAEIIESQVTTPLEDSLSGIEGIELIQSISRVERSQITVRFLISRNVDDAASDVRDRVSRVRGQLPLEIDEPIIAKVEADAQPIIWLSFTSDRLNQLEVTDVIDRLVRDRMQTIDGVSGVRIFGERRYAMRLWLDKARMAAYQVTVQDVETALRRQNLEVPAGRIESAQREFTVVTETDLRTPAQFDNLIIRDSGGYLVRLRDVGRAELEARDARIFSRTNGRNSVNMGVIKTSTANPLDVSNEVRRRLGVDDRGNRIGSSGGVVDDPERGPTLLVDELAQLGIDADVTYDTSVFIDRSIKNVFHTIFEAVALVVLVIFVFLRSLRATLIPLVTIPVSLIGAMTLMLAFGFSINTLTLLAMVLAIGLVVDDAIVVLENISRYVEQGMHPFHAALKGSREIAFAVVAMTLTLAAVYAPIAFQTGRTGKLFTEFALTLAGAVLVSGFVALSASPMMCSLLLKGHEKHGRIYRAMEAAFNGLTAGYRWLLGMSLRARPVVAILALAVAGAAVLLFRVLPSELAPIEDRGAIANVMIAPEGATPDYTIGYSSRLEDIYLDKARFPDVQRLLVIVGFPDVTRGLAFARLRDWDERKEKQQSMTARARPLAAQIPGLLAFPINPPSFGQRTSDKPVQFVLQTSQPFQELSRQSDRFMEMVRQHPRLSTGLTALDTDLRLNKPELRVRIDREKVAYLGIEVDTIGRTLESMLGGRQVTRFKKEGKQYDVVVQVADVERTNPNDLANIFVRGRPPSAQGSGATAPQATGGSPAQIREQQQAAAAAPSTAAGGGFMVPLSNLVTYAETVAPRELNHFNKLRSAIISANLTEGYALGQALADLREVASGLPGFIVTDYAGQSREFVQSAGGLWMTFGMALLFIYLVLAAQFESFVDPLIIMLTVPITMTGALWALLATGNTLNVYSQIGLVTLIGLITKHGILIVEFANQLQDHGKNRMDAVKEAAELRLRPILMTTGAMVLGAVPLALGTGAGGESRQAIGWTIVGGMTLGTVLTLFVVPTAYTWLARVRRPHPADRAAAHHGGAGHGHPEHAPAAARPAHGPAPHPAE